MKFWIISLLIIFPLISCASTNLELQKRQEEAARNLGEAYMAQGNYTSALKEFLKAKTLYSDDPLLQNDLGLAYMGKEKLDIAIQHFKRAIELSPDYAPAKNNLGTAYIAKKDWDTAIIVLKKVTEDILYATPHYPLSNLGLAYYNKKKYKIAEQYYQEALEQYPDFLIALRGLGKTYIALGKFSNAVETLEKAVKKARSGSKIYPELYLDLAEAYSLSKQNKKAIDAYRKVIALAPDTPLAEEATRGLSRIRKR